VIDARAVVHPAARIAADVTIGPFSVIGADVEIGAGCVIGPHVVIRGPTRIGRDNRVFQFASVGEDSADRKYAGEPTRLEIGDHNVIREAVTIHRGTMQDRGVTTIGSHNLLMAGVHVAHDSLIGDHVVFVNNAAVAGHVTVGDWAVLGGYTLVQQRARIGAHSFAAMGSVIRKDVPAFVRVAGHPARPRGLNREGLGRRGFRPEALRALAVAYRTLYRSRLTTAAALDALEPLAARHAEVRLFVDSVRGAAAGIVR
jgi:UDP-N-acetylglucosamine acyltransferase